MAGLTTDQIERFRTDGYVTVGGAVTDGELAALRGQCDDWIAEANRRGAGFGETIDGRARFDLELKDPAHPALRRVNNPVDVSDSYQHVMADSAMTDMVADLIGPDVKFHHSKINLKLPGATTEVGFHQDFPYTPHTNADIVTALLMLDDMTPENGPLTIVPGSHREGLFSLWHDDRFTGTVADDVRARYADRLVSVTGKAGSVCLMHTLLLHGSAANRSDRPRGLFICVYTAADAIPLAPSPLPNSLEGQVVRGSPSRVARLEEMAVELPERYTDATFFDVQARAAQQD